MAEISAAAVMKLRKMSGQGMMDCKKALTEADGDLEKALDLLRKKGLATLSKRAERETSQGLVIFAKGGNWASLATLCCETDFVAKSDDFLAAVESVREYMAQCQADCGADNLQETQVNGKKFADIITETVSRTGEKMVVGDYARYHLSGPSLIGSYIHFNGKVGAMVKIETSADSVAAADAVRQIANELAMHITATKPTALDRDGIDAATIDRERSIYAEQARNKQPQIVEKIIEGKMRNYFTENCLLEQPFVKDDSKSVEQVLTDAAKQAGGKAKIKEFVRFEVG
jgi:elongation factor Ts